MQQITGLKQFSAKLFISSFITIAVMVSMSLFWLLPSLEKRLLVEKEEGIRKVVEISSSLITEYEGLIKSRQLTVKEAQEAVKESLRHVRYDGMNYVWINDMTPRMIMHPYTTELEGKDVRDYKDPAGKLLFMEMIKVCAERGEGIVSYQWTKPNTLDTYPKISYVKLYKPWNWIIGTGIYVDDVKANIRNIRWAIIGATVALGIIMVFAGIFVQLLYAKMARHTQLLEKAYNDLKTM